MSATAKPAGRFTGSLVIEKAGRNQRWRIYRGFSYVTAAGDWIQIPKGFIYDGASIPRLAWAAYAPMGGAYDMAAAMHDFLLYRRKNGSQKYTRPEIDRLFLEAMLASGVDRLDAGIIYSAVAVHTAIEGGERAEAASYDPYNEYLDT